MTTFPTESTADDGALIGALGGCTVLDCRVRLIRADGWSWGPDPSELARGAVAMLPRVVEQYLAGSLPHAEPPWLVSGARPAPHRGLAPPAGLASQDMSQDVEITAPVRIRSRATLGALLAAAALTPDGDGASGAEPGATVIPHRAQSPAVPGATARTHTADTDADADADSPAPASAVRGSGGSGSPAPAADRDRVLVGLLNEAAACGVLDTLLAGLAHGVLLLLLHALDAAGHRTPSGPGSWKGSSAGRPRAIREGGGVSSSGTRGSGRPTPDALAAALQAALRSVPPDRTDLARMAADPDHEPGTTPPARPPAVPGHPEEHRAGPVSGTVTDTDRALPFLLLSPLQDRGYLQALAAVLSGGGAQHADSAAFAACLAHKVLPPPTHGWLRSPQDTHAVGVFAGTTPTHPGTSYISAQDLEHRLGPLLALLDARLGLQAAQGHAATSPLLLHAVAPGRLLLLDVDGLYLMWDARQPAELLRPWELAGTPLVLLPARPDTPATAELTLALDALGIGFVTDVPPSRDEPLSRVPGPRRCWTNTGARLPSRSTPDDALVGAARRLTYEASRAARLVEALVELRPAVRAGRAPAVERTTTLAAGVALADLAWKLWSEREPADPVNALDRFADLGARVAFHDSTVEVRLPLGARHADLYRHRLLADVPDVPWFGGRTVVFTGG